MHTLASFVAVGSAAVSPPPLRSRRRPTQTDSPIDSPPERTRLIGALRSENRQRRLHKQALDELQKNSSTPFKVRLQQTVERGVELARTTDFSTFFVLLVLATTAGFALHNHYKIRRLENLFLQIQ